jgi:hypothetical protein
MSDTHTDLVIQISAADANTADTNADKREDRQLIIELKTCLQPGVEIALVFEGYMAMTSILWLSDIQPDGSVRAGIRLLGVSAIPTERPEFRSAWDDSSGPALAGAPRTAAIIRQPL